MLAVLSGFVLAALTGMIVLFVLGARWAAEEATSFTPQNADEFSRSFNEGLGVLAFFMTVAPLLTLLPAVLAALIGEIARIRSILYYVIAGGAAAVLMPLIATRADMAGPAAYSGQYFAIIATAGFAGGFVYWLIAGRNA
jgi:hypothetical protein